MQWQSIFFFCIKEFTIFQIHMHSMCDIVNDCNFCCAPFQSVGRSLYCCIFISIAHLLVYQQHKFYCFNFSRLSLALYRSTPQFVYYFDCFKHDIACGTHSSPLSLIVAILCALHILFFTFDDSRSYSSRWRSKKRRTKIISTNFRYSSWKCNWINLLERWMKRPHWIIINYHYSCLQWKKSLLFHIEHPNLIGII